MIWKPKFTVRMTIRRFLLLPRSQPRNPHLQHGPRHGNQMDGRSQQGHQQQNQNQVRLFRYLLFIIFVFGMTSGDFNHKLYLSNKKIMVCTIPSSKQTCFYIAWSPSWKQEKVTASPSKLIPFVYCMYNLLCFSFLWYTNHMIYRAWTKTSLSLSHSPLNILPNSHETNQSTHSLTVSYTHCFGTNINLFSRIIYKNLTKYFPSLFQT